MKKIIISVALSVMAMSSYAATTPAEQAGICATNALFLKKFADASGPSYDKLGQLASAQMGKNYSRYGQDPGFKQATAWALKQNTPLQDRVKIADGCAKEGF